MSADWRITDPTPEAIREFMDRHGMTRTIFANKLYVSRLAVNKWLLPRTSRYSREMPLGLWELALRQAGEWPNRGT